MRAAGGGTASLPDSSIGSMSDLLAELSWRGLVQDRSEGLEERLSGGPISAYVGFDASGPSLHVGHLIPLMALVHLQRYGGRPVYCTEQIEQC